jgi:acyl-CoA thioester hydrolase
VKREATVLITVPFHDVDIVGVTWHGHYAKYFEIARCALLDTFGYGYREMQASGYIWPVIDLHLRYVKPAAFGQSLCVRATLAEWEHRLKINYLITDDATGTVVTRGESVQVAVEAATQTMLLVSPDVLFERLGIARV